MKKLPLLIFIISLVIHGQSSRENSIIIDSSNFKSSSFEKRDIVLLGEMTHMYSSVFEEKIKLFKILHERYGYNTLAMEGSYFDYNQLQENWSKEELLKITYTPWKMSSIYQDFIDYLLEENIKVVGFDSQILETEAFLTELESIIENENIQLSFDQNEFFIITEGVLDAMLFDETEVSFEDYQKQLDQIIKVLQHKPVQRQYIKSLKANTTSAYLDSIPQPDRKVFISSLSNPRDKQMADNLLFYHKEHPDEKIVAWADNLHLAGDISSYDHEEAKLFKPMGSYLREALGESVFSIATIHANDSIHDGAGTWHSLPIENASFEDKMKKTGLSRAYVLSDQQSLKKISSRLFSYQYFFQGNLNDYFDAYLFLGHAQQIIHQSQKKTAIKIDNSSEVLKKTMVLVDQTNKETIPFATISSDDYYTMSNMQGEFQIPENKNLNLSIKVLGYYPKEIHQFKDSIYLIPEYDQLSAIEIKGESNPDKVLDQAIKNLKKNHPFFDHNITRNAEVKRVTNGSILLDFEVSTLDYSSGYNNKKVNTQQALSVDWKQTPEHRKEKYRYVAKQFAWRENPIQYASILHKRKSHKFNLEFIDHPEYSTDDYYAISFVTPRDNWNFTNQIVPSSYFGLIIIEKDSYAIVEVQEQWDSDLDEVQIKEHLSHTSYKDDKQYRSKEWNISKFNNIKDGKRYISENSSIYQVTLIDEDEQLSEYLIEKLSNFINPQTEELTKIPWYLKDKSPSDLLNINYTQ